MPPRASQTIRLAIQVLPLAEEDARGTETQRALETFKGRKFALPVQWQDTLSTVWKKIEQRYAENYLDAQQAAAYSIKKLQDAYDCDLDVRDTVSSIFAAETDAAMRTIKVVPAYVGRDFSVPVTTHLRPASAKKRTRLEGEEPANKRRRTGPSPDQPMLSTEHSPDQARSGTADSLVFMHDAHTGQPEFAVDVKEEQEDEQEDEQAEEQEEEHDGRAPGTATRRRDLYDIPSSPELLTGPSPRNANTVQSETNLLNASRLQPTPSRPRRKEPRQAPHSAEKGTAVAEPPSGDQYELWTVKALRKELESRGLSSRGHSKTLIKRLREDDLPKSLTASPKKTPARRGRLPTVSATKERSAKKASAARTSSPSKPTAATDSWSAINDPPATTAHLNGDTWGFENLEQPTNAEPDSLEQAPAPAEAHDHADSESDSDSGSDLVPAHGPDHASRSRSGSAAVPTASEQQEVLDFDDTEQLIQSQLNGHPPSAPESPSDPARLAGSKSPSASAAVSDRNSPAVSRRPARYLSRSPSRDSGSESGPDENEKLGSPAPPTQAANEGEDIDSGNDESSDSSTDDDDEVEDEVEEVLKVPESPAAADTITASQALPSSPPTFPTAAPQASLPPQSAQTPVSASQPIIRRTPVPVPTNVPKSSQSAATRATAIRPKLAGRRSDFPSLSELVADTKKPATPVSQKKAFDPRSMSLNKLAGKVLKGNVQSWGQEADESDSDEEEENSDSD